MALTQGAWTQTFVNGLYVAKCTVTVGLTSDDDCYTLKTPSGGLDPSKPWTFAFYGTAAADNSVPIDLWIGWEDKFALSGNDGTVTAGAYGAEYKQIMDDAVLAIATAPVVFLMDPYLEVADVVTAAAIASGADGLKIKVPIAPYYAFNVDGANLVAQANYFIVTQKTDKVGI